jgi:F420-non-reducing hydrogenase iron-sulfur subunit
MGPFKPERYRLQLAAVEGALNTPRLRWLVGIDRQLTERENVYHEKINQEEYHKLLEAAVEREYHKALVLEVMKENPMSVREIAERTDLSIYTVSLRLGDLEKSGDVDLAGYEGTTPMFTGMTG